MRGYAVGRLCVTLAILFTGYHTLFGQEAAVRPFVIRVVDQQTGRGVPLVELRTTAAARYITDSQGVVAFWEPGWMSRRVFFYVESDGYQIPPDGFGFAGRALDVTPGGSATLEVQRTQFAQRLYRVTGAGIYRDSVMAGLEVPVRHPLLNAGVVGSDSVVNVMYRGRLFWFWGDTNRTEYPLGNFHVPGAVSRLPQDGGLDPRVGVELEYFRDAEGHFAKETAKMPGEGPTWIDALVVLPDRQHNQILLAAYVKVKPPMDVYRHGLCRWDEQAEQFVPLVVFAEGAPFYPTGHPVVAQCGSQPYVYFTDPLGVTRCPAQVEAMADLESYEAYTCLIAKKNGEAGGASLSDVDRGPDGTVRYRWRRGAPPLRSELADRLVKAGKLHENERLLALRDWHTMRPIAIHRGGLAWNEYRRRWISVFTRFGGSSLLGEVWYSEADAPWGPWCYAVKVAEHKRYSFYNPKLHPYFDQDNGRRIFFEGTYSHTFSGNPDAKPWYDYNQLMYCLELDDPRVAVPVAYYRSDDPQRPPSVWAARNGRQLAEAPMFEDFQRIVFFAWDRPVPGAVALTWHETRGYGVTDKPGSDEQLVAYILPEAQDRPGLVPLYEVTTDPMSKRLRVGGDEKDGTLLGWVWPSPYGAGSPASGVGLDSGQATEVQRRPSHGGNR
ncbi:MAG: hypothetical protein KatS3mg110_3425 [Pirellulaceae bacterium]|nr:MAG: hypothetical protein KatS3mg110_3425 [Pirellulaceae bacterium]